MRAGLQAPGECVAPRPASAPTARSSAPARPFPPISLRGHHIPSECQFGGSCCPGLRDLFSVCKLLQSQPLSSLDLAQAGVVIPERAYLGASHPAGSGTTMSNPSRTLPALAVPPGGAEEQAQIGLAAAPALGEPVPPSGARHPYDPHHPRRDPDRRVSLASLSRRSRGDRLPRGGESLHPRRHAPHRGAAGAALSGDAGPDQGDRSLGPRADRRLALLHPHRGRRPVSHLLPPARPRRIGRGGPAGPEPPGGGARLLPDGRLRGQSRPPPAGLFGGHQRRRGVPAGGQGPEDRRAAGRADRELLALGRLGQRQPHPLLRPARLGAPSLPAPSPSGGRHAPRPTSRSTSRPTSRSSSTSAGPGAAAGWCSTSRATRPRRSGCSRPTGPRASSASSSRAARASSTG